MNIIESLKYIGLEVPVFLAGTSGAIVFLSKSSNMTHSQRFLTVLSGGLSANYLTPLVGNWLNLGNEVLYGVAFLLGFSGMETVKLLIRLLTKKISQDD